MTQDIRYKVCKTKFNIYGTNTPQVIIKSNRFHKLEVTLYQAPPTPERIIAHSYLECIEDRNLINPLEIPYDEAKKITEHVLLGGHTPSLEALYFLFNIRGMSRVVSHQIVRHRIGVSIDQRTQRANSEEYLGKISDNEHFITPPSIAKLMAHDADVKAMATEYIMRAQSLYNRLLKENISQDDARYFIPQASESSMNFKVIYKALLDSVCSTRLCHLMQGELVEIVNMMKIAVDKYNPYLGSWLKPFCLKNGRCNRNENNPNDDNPKGVCQFTIDGTIPVRGAKTVFDLTKYSRDASK